MRYSIAEMIIDFKTKADKLDSKDFTDIPLPIIIRLLNEAQLSTVLERYGENNIYHAGFESNQKRIDELSTLVVPEEVLIMSILPGKTSYPNSDNIYSGDLTNTKEKYLFLLRCNFIACTSICTGINMNGIQTTTDDLDRILNSPFECPSLEWRETPYRITNKSLRAYSDNSYTVSHAVIDYLRYPKDMDITGYTHRDGSISTTTECELPEFLRKTIVNKAVLSIKESLKDNIQYESLRLQQDE